MRGIYTALITPFNGKGEIDLVSLEKLLKQQISNGVKGFVVCGTTGECPTLSKEEKEKLFRFIITFSEGKNLDLIAGTGTNDTRESIALTRMAAEIGYRQFLTVVPYYNRPSQAGLRAHFEAIADTLTDGVVILYNVPSRTGTSLTVETIVELAAHPKIQAIKEASGDLKFLTEIQDALARVGRSLSLLSGDDLTYYPFLLSGGHGVISVASQICPGGMLEIADSVAKGDRKRGDALQAAYSPIFRDLFIESNPGPLKWVLAKLGLAENQLRLPLVPVEKATAEKLEKMVSQYEIEADQLVAGEIGR